MAPAEFREQIYIYIRSSVIVMKITETFFLFHIQTTSLREMEALVVYESTMGRTKAMAKAICEGVTSAGMTCRLIEAQDFPTTLSGVCALAVGSSTRMKRPLPRTRQILSELPDLGGLPAVSYGSYGWSGEAPDEIANALRQHGARVIMEPLKVKDYPDERALSECRELGKRLAASCRID